MSGTWRCVGTATVAGIALLGLVGGLEMAAGRLRVDSSSTFLASRTNDVTDLGQDVLNAQQEYRQNVEPGPTEGWHTSEATLWAQVLDAQAH